MLSKTTLRNLIFHFCLVISVLGLLLPSFAQAQPEQTKDEHILVPGDVLLISIPGTDPIEQTHIIDFNGDIDLGIHGKVSFAGLSIQKAQNAIRRHMSQFLHSTKGIVLLHKELGKTVLVTGCVNQPGLVTVLSTGDLWQAISAAGGPSVCADLTTVSVIRKGEEKVYDLRSTLTRDSKEFMLSVDSGDTIFVASKPDMSASLDAASVFLSESTINRKIFVLGAVVSPGIFDRTEVVDIVTAISLAGGPTTGADLSHVILLTKDDSRTIDVQKIFQTGNRGKSPLPPAGESGAILYIPNMAENIDTRLGSHINVIGPFVRTGRFPVSGPITLADAIGLAGGPSENARIKRIRVIEEGPGYTLASRYNMKKYYRNGGYVGRVEIMPGSTLVVGRNNFGTFSDIVRLTGNIAMISSAVAMWITFAQNQGDN